jgi:hypothetical protein
MGKDPELKSDAGMIRAGAALSLGAMLVLLLFRRWRLARWAAGMAAAFVEQWRENHLGANVRDLLAKSGRET